MRKEISERMLPDAKSLDLSDLAITDSEIKEIVDYIVEKYPALQLLNLSHNALSDKSASPISDTLHPLLSLNFLDLQFNRLDEEGMQTLFKLKNSIPHLQLALAGNLMTDASVADWLGKTYRL